MSDLVEFLERYGVEHSTTDKHSRSGWVQVHCENCGSTKFHLGIREDCRRAACWKCGPKNSGTVLKHLTDAPWSEIKALLGDTRFVEAEPEKVYGGYRPPKGLGPLLPSHRKYLTKRGFSANYLSDTWDAQGLGPMGEFSHRVFLPITRNKKPVSWTCRSIIPTAELRYITATDDRKSFHEKHLIFGEDKARKGVLLVTEGPFDAINLGPGAGATLGLSYTNQQLAIMATYQRRIIIFDNSESAQRVAAKLCEDLSVFPGVTQQVTMDADDPGSASKNEVNLVRKFAGLPSLW